MHIGQIQKNLIPAIARSLKILSRNASLKKDLPEDLKIDLEIPKDYKHGDLTTNIAMRVAKNFGVKSLQLAGSLKEELEKALLEAKLNAFIKQIEVSPPGFINFKLSDGYLFEVLDEIRKNGIRFGRGDWGKDAKVNIEFVSANPTGPLTVAHGRQAAVGDALARILEFSGYKVSREYFINDVGTQIDLLGASIYARYLSQNGKACEFPEDGYHGDYIKDIAKELNDKYGSKLLENIKKNIDLISEFGADRILRTIEEDLENFGVRFDRWFSQKKLSKNQIEDALERLRRKGYIYKKDGAVWFRSTAFKDDKDRVVIKSDGSYTYLGPDIAYHFDKFGRKFDRLIDIWGPDHHGYILRLLASVEALGFKRESVSILIVQLATIFRGGVALSMSTRKGEFITLREVVSEVGSDVAKFFFLMRKIDSHLDFDLEIAKKNSLDNPVYYIQYAHARISSILRFCEKIKDKLKKTKYDRKLLSESEEMLLLRMLVQFSFIVEASARKLEPYRLIDYLNELAKVFHNFYTKHRVVSDDNIPLTKARLVLVSGVKAVLANGLGLLGISLPERM